MDFNQYIHEMLSGSEDNIRELAADWYSAEFGEDLFELHPADQQFYFDSMRAILQVLQGRLMSFNSNVSSD